MQITLSIWEKPGLDLILGIDFFEDVEAVVNLRGNPPMLFGGLESVIKTTTGENPVVVTSAAVVIPPMFEVVFPVNARAKIKGAS